MSAPPHRRLGGDDAAAIVGVHPYKDSNDVWRRIVLGEKAPPNPKMLRGITMEPVLRGMALERWGGELEIHPGVVYSQTHRFACAAPDDLVDLGGRLVCREYKSISRWGAHLWASGPREHVVLQVLWTLAVCGRDSCQVVGGFGADLPDGSFDLEELAMWEVERDLAKEEELFAAADVWWTRYIDGGEEPQKQTKARKKRVPKSKQEEGKASTGD